MEDSNHRGRAISPFESKGNEEQHPDEGGNRDGYRLIPQLLARHLSHGFGALDLVSCFGIVFQRLSVRIGFRPEGVERLLDLFARRVYAGLSFTIGRFLKSLVRYFDEKLALLVQHRLNDGIFDTRLIDCRAQRVGGRGLLEPHD